MTGRLTLYVILSFSETTKAMGFTFKPQLDFHFQKAFTFFLSDIYTSHVGVVDHLFTPHSTAVVFVGSDAKLVGCVGFEVVNHSIGGRTGLIDPLPVSFSVADCVMPVSKTN